MPAQCRNLNNCLFSSLTFPTYCNNAAIHPQTLVEFCGPPHCLTAKRFGVFLLAMALRLLGFAVTLGIVSQPCACTEATTGCTPEFPAKGSTCDATEGQEASMLLQPLRPSSWPGSRERIPIPYRSVALVGYTGLIGKFEATTWQEAVNIAMGTLAMRGLVEHGWRCASCLHLPAEWSCCFAHREGGVPVSSSNATVPLSGAELEVRFRCEGHMSKDLAAYVRELNLSARQREQLSDNLQALGIYQTSQLQNHAISDVFKHIPRTQILESKVASLQQAEKVKLKLEPGKAKVDLGNLSSIPAFVLNLERRKDRLGNFSRVLYEQAPWLHKITCRVAAHDGKAFGDRLKESLIPDTIWQSAVSRDKYQNRTVGGSLTKGGVALIMGHAIMWEHLLQTQAPWGIFMEDDLTYIHPDLGSLLEKLGKSLPAPGHDWDRLQIQGEGQGLDCPNYSLQAPLHIRNGSGPTSGMYIITREAARSALEAYFPIQGGQLDNTHSFLRSQCRGHHICPIPARQPGSYKDTRYRGSSLFLFFVFISGAPYQNCNQEKGTRP